MTRDEAVKKAEECFQYNVPGQEWFFTPLRLVAALENLGLLKIDEPKSSPEAMLCDILYHEGLRGLAQRAVIDAMTSAGLKVVHRTPQESE
ncbi:hypothetical protein V1290_000004 [Bradyrhizobium sp. AZCC 1578]|uniref:hypothetical protein n=1 Tax=Bradyrhizobium sp. AZCC 1578 TaxID=3117027 RepID=UPI002FF166E6